MFLDVMCYVTTSTSREELNKYLTDFREKKGEDGAPLVNFPHNFDSIAEAMSRKDLMSTEEKYAMINQTLSPEHFVQPLE